MAEETNTEISERDLDNIYHRIKSLEKSSTKPGFFGLGSWKDLVILGGLPLAMITGALTFYDQVWTRADKEVAAEATVALRKLDTLQGLNAEIIQLSFTGGDGEASAILEAKRGHKQRLVNDIYSFWTRQPTYFTWHDKQSLANNFLMQHRSDLALEITNTLDEENLGLIDQADLEIFKARIYSSDGPVFNLDAARGHVKAAMKLADGLPRDGQKYEMWEKFLVVWLGFELHQNTGCKQAGPIADLLNDILFVPASDDVSSPLLKPAKQLLSIYKERCE